MFLIYNQDIDFEPFFKKGVIMLLIGTVVDEGNTEKVWLEGLREGDKIFFRGYGKGIVNQFQENVARQGQVSITMEFGGTCNVYPIRIGKLPN